MLDDGDSAWRQLLRKLITIGDRVSPRGQPTREVMHNQLTLDMARPVVTTPERKLNYRFMCAEALWIIDGDNRVETVAKYNKKMREFSDDGVILAGAYGPRLVPQLPYVIESLARDRDTRQAVASIWTPSPAASKDIPCTVALIFSVRRNHLHMHVMMRSSDAWLGIPYDMFSFACVGLFVLCSINQMRAAGDKVYPGAITFSLTSSHLYDRDLEKAWGIIKVQPACAIAAVPTASVLEGDWASLRRDLEYQRDNGPIQFGWRVSP